MTQYCIKDSHYLPFIIRGGLFQTRGILRLESQVLTVEFQYFFNLFPTIRSGINTVYIPFLSFHRAELTTKLTQQILWFQSNSLHPFCRIPGANSGQAQFVIPHYAREQATEFVRCLQLRLSEHHLNQNEEDRALRAASSCEKRIELSALRLLSKVSL